MLDRAASELPGALRLQRQALEEKQRLLARAINAIADAEKAIRPGEPANSAVLKKLIGAIEMQEVDVAQYFSEEAFAKMRQFCERAPSEGWMEEWKELRRDVEAAMEEDPAGEAGQALALRYRAFMQRSGGSFDFVNDPDVMAGLKKAGAERQNWPVGLARRFRESSTAKVVQFLLKAMAALRDQSETS